MSVSQSSDMKKYPYQQTVVKVPDIVSFRCTEVKGSSRGVLPSNKLSMSIRRHQNMLPIRKNALQPFSAIVKRWHQHHHIERCCSAYSDNSILMSGFTLCATEMPQGVLLFAKGPNLSVSSCCVSLMTPWTDGPCGANTASLGSALRTQAELSENAYRRLWHVGSFPCLWVGKLVQCSYSAANSQFSCSQADPWHVGLRLGSRY